MNTSKGDAGIREESGIGASQLDTSPDKDIHTPYPKAKTTEEHIHVPHCDAPLPIEVREREERTQKLRNENEEYQKLTSASRKYTNEIIRIHRSLGYIVFQVFSTFQNELLDYEEYSKGPHSTEEFIGRRIAEFIRSLSELSILLKKGKLVRMKTRELNKEIMRQVDSEIEIQSSPTSAKREET